MNSVGDIGSVARDHIHQWKTQLGHLISATQVTWRYSAGRSRRRLYDQSVKTRWNKNVPSSNSPHLQSHTSATSRPASHQYHKSATIPSTLFREWVAIFSWPRLDFHNLSELRLLINMSSIIENVNQSLAHLNVCTPICIQYYSQHLQFLKLLSNVWLPRWR